MTAGTEPAIDRTGRARRFNFTLRHAGGVLALLLLAAAATGTVMWWRESNSARAMRLLVHAFSQRRPVEGRLAGGFKGAAFAPPAETDTLLQSEEIIEAGRCAGQAMSSNEPGARLVYARLLLLTGDKDAATLRAFRQAVAAEPDNAAASNDIGVCLLARGELEEALAAFDTALELRPQMVESQFNRALCYQHLYLRKSASNDFARLLEGERDSGWREEIRRRHEEVSAPVSSQKLLKEVSAAFDSACAAGEIDEATRIAGESLTLLLTHAYENCYGEAIKAAADGDAEVSRREIFKIRLIGEQLDAACGDKSVLEMATHVEGLSREAAAGEAALAREYLEIINLPSLTAMLGRQNDLLTLAARFKESGNLLFEFYSLYQAGFLSHWSTAFDEALRQTDDALQLAKSQAWPYRRASALMQMSGTCARVGKDSLALDYGRQAMRETQDLPYTEAKSLQLMANAYSHLGDLRQVLECLLRSSHIFSTKTPSLNDLANNLLQAADCYRLMDNHRLALLCGREALACAEESGEVQSRIAQAASFVAVELARQNQLDESEEAMQRALAALAKTRDLQRAHSELLVGLRAAGLSSQKGDMQQAEQYYARAKSLAESGKDRLLPLIHVLRARAESYALAGRAQAARDDLEQAIPLIEDYRAHITEKNNRNDFFDASQDVFDRLIRLRGTAFGQWDGAFNLAEQARARTLIDDLSLAAGQAAAHQGGRAPATASPRALPTLTLKQVQAALPNDLTLVSYSVSSQGTLIFVVTRNTFEVAESAATTESLDRLVQDYIAALQERAPIAEFARPSRRLYELLIAPVESKLAATRLLCVAPDKALHRLPFSALMDTKGKYLIQSHSLSSAPSASTLAYCIFAARAKKAAAESSVLAVGNPQFSRDDFPTLKMLPEAEHEATESAGPYAHKVILNGPDATKARVLAELPRCDVAHLSTHCLVEEKTPWLAALLMTRTAAGKADEMLRLNELNKIGLLRARLVILSACQSGLGQYYRGEGIVSLVRPFLAQGVPTVVASLWPVDSQATASLMIDFHHARTRPRPHTADALRSAQLLMLQSSSFDHPYYWAPFVVIGNGN